MTGLLTKLILKYHIVISLLVSLVVIWSSYENQLQFIDRNACYQNCNMVFWSSKSGINSKYTFSSSPTFTSDPWSVYTGRPKSSSALGRLSLLQFDKKQFENYLLNYGIIKSKSSSQDKMLIQEAYQILKNQVNNLTKLKHPNILTVVEPIEEHSKTFLFVTE